MGKILLRDREVLNLLSFLHVVAPLEFQKRKVFAFVQKVFGRVKKIIVPTEKVFVGDRSVELGVCLTCGAALSESKKRRLASSTSWLENRQSRGDISEIKDLSVLTSQ